MPAGVALSRANVEGPDGFTAADAAVLVRQGRLRVTARKGAELVNVDGVTLVERLNVRDWRITTDAGVWTITRSKNCGCGK